MSRYSWSWICTAIILALSACEEEEVLAESKTPGETAWPVITPKKARMDVRALHAFSDGLGGNGVIIRRDSLVHSWGKINQRMDIASASKPVLVHLLFKAIESGKIASLDEPVVKWEPGLGLLNAALGNKDAKITWRHLSNQTSCYGAIEQPGAAFDYNDYQTQLFWNLLMLKVYAATTDEADDKAMGPELFNLLGSQDTPSMKTRAASEMGPQGRVMVSARDLARLGLLYLHDGKWGDSQVIGEQWVKMAIGTPLPLSLPRSSGKPAEMLPGARSFGGGANQEDHMGCYSFMWWLNRPDAQGRLLWPDVPPDAFAAIGHGGPEALVVIPSLDLVVSWNSVNMSREPLWTKGREQMNLALKRLIAAVH